MGRPADGMGTPPPTTAGRFVPAGDQADGNPPELSTRPPPSGRAVGGTSERTQFDARRPDQRRSQAGAPGSTYPPPQTEMVATFLTPTTVVVSAPAAEMVHV